MRMSEARTKLFVVRVVVGRGRGQWKVDGRQHDFMSGQHARRAKVWAEDGGFVDVCAFT